MKTRMFGLMAALTMGFVACNSNGDSTAAADSTTTDGTTNETATSTTSSGSYAAQADSFRINSEAGNYIDAKTGKPIRIKVDPTTGSRINEETNEPVRYYVDRRTWWVYGDDSWDTVGSAQMEGDKLRFRSDNDKWVSFEEKWKVDGGDGEMKNKTEDGKTKIEKDGDLKIKTEDGTKIKADEDGVKVKKDEK